MAWLASLSVGKPLHIAATRRPDPAAGRPAAIALTSYEAEMRPSLEPVAARAVSPS